MIKFYGSPLRTWRKAKKYFRFPDIKFHLITYPYSYYKFNWYDFLHISDIIWKDKYNSPRHEGNPYIIINLFNLIQFQWEFGRWINNKDYSLEYWESLLYYTKYNKSILESLNYSIWTDMKGNKTPIIKVCLWKR